MVVAASVTLVVLVAQGMGVLESAERAVTHAKFRWAGPDSGTTDIVHVDIDDGSLLEFGRWSSWSRTDLAAVVEALDAAGARTIALDLLFDDDEAPELLRLADGSVAELDPDDVLAAAMAASEATIVVPINAAPEPWRRSHDEFERDRARWEAARSKLPPASNPPDWHALAAPILPIADAADTFGLVEAPEATSGIRLVDVPAWRESGAVRAWQLGLAAAGAHLGVPPERIGVRDDTAVIGDRRVPIDGTSIIIPWVAPPDGPADRSHRWMGVHRHINIGQVRHLGEQRRTVRRAITALTGRDPGHRWTEADVDEAREHLAFYFGEADADRLAALAVDPAGSDEAERARAAMLARAGERLLTLTPAAAPNESWDRLAALVGGKLVFIGWAATGAAADVHVTPLGERTPGVVAHAAIADGVLAGRGIRRAPPWAGLALTAVSGLAAGAACLGGSVAVSLVLVVLIAAGVMAFDAAVLFGGRGVLAEVVPPLLACGLVWAACTAEHAVRLRREKSALQAQFRARVAPQLVEMLTAHPERVNVEGEARIVTCLFADLSGFTALTERLGAREAVALLNRLMTALTTELIGRGAYVNKFLGDGVMALWNAPTEDDRHAARACEAALACIAAAGRIEDGDGVGVRIGIATGEAIVGDCGAPPALNDYTAVGEPVNLAARLEQANKGRGTAVLAARATIESMSEVDRGCFEVRDLGEMTLEGLSRPVGVVEVVGWRAP